MKRISSLTLILSLFLITQIDAQDIKYTLIVDAGINYFNTNSPAFENGNDIGGKVEIAYKIKGPLYVVSGIGYESLSVNVASDNERIGAMTLPTNIMYDAYPNKNYGPFGVVGIGHRYLLHGDTEGFSKYTASINMGIGYDIDLGFGLIGVEVNGDWGINNFIPDSRRTKIDNYKFGIRYGFN